MEILRKLECIYAALRLDNVNCRNQSIINKDYNMYMERLGLLERNQYIQHAAHMYNKHPDYGK